MIGPDEAIVGLAIAQQGQPEQRRVCHIEPPASVRRQKIGEPFFPLDICEGAPVLFFPRQLDFRVHLLLWLVEILPAKTRSQNRMPS